MILEPELGQNKEGVDIDMRVVFFTLLGILLFNLDIKFINSCDDDIIGVKRSEIVIMTILIAISTTLLIFKYDNIDFVYYYYLSIYLLLVAYVDKKTMNIYTLFPYMTFAVGIIYFFHKNTWVNYNEIIYVIIYIVLIEIFSRNKSFNTGDRDIFISITFFLCSYDTLLTLLLNILLSEFIFIIINIKEIINNKGKLSNPKAFAPYIAMSTYIVIFILK